jgi:hypothetical protein
LQHKKILLKKPVLSILKFFIFSSLKVADLWPQGSCTQLSKVRSTASCGLWPSIPIFDSANYIRNWWFWIFQILRTKGYVIPPLPFSPHWLIPRFFFFFALFRWVCNTPTALFHTLVNTRVFFFFFCQISKIN